MPPPRRSQRLSISPLPCSISTQGHLAPRLARLAQRRCPIYFKNNVPPSLSSLLSHSSSRSAPMLSPTPISSPLPAKCKYHGSIFVPPQARLKVTISHRSASFNFTPPPYRGQTLPTKIPNCETKSYEEFMAFKEQKHCVHDGIQSTCTDWLICFGIEMC